MHQLVAQMDMLVNDVRPDLVEKARANVSANRAPIRVVEARFFDGVGGDFDCVTFNVPYVPSALVSGIATIQTHNTTTAVSSDISFGLSLGLDYVALSFVRSPDDAAALHAFSQVVLSEHFLQEVEAALDENEPLLTSLRKLAERRVKGDPDAFIEVRPEYKMERLRRIVHRHNKNFRIIILRNGDRRCDPKCFHQLGNSVAMAYHQRITV